MPNLLACVSWNLPQPLIQQPWLAHLNAQAEIFSALRDRFASFQRMVEQTSTFRAIYEAGFLFSAGAKLSARGWPGFSIMPRDLLEQIVQTEADVSPIVESWVVNHRVEIAASISDRLQSYELDEIGHAAMVQALDNYGRGHDLAVVRTLMPEVERYGRLLFATPSAPLKQNAVVEKIKALILDQPLSGLDVEVASIVPLLCDHLFTSCWTSEQAAAQGPFPNRHAEAHGLASYGTIQGASAMVGIVDFTLRCIRQAREP